MEQAWLIWIEQIASGPRRSNDSQILMQEAGMPDPSPVVLITGASSGIGEATARLLGRAGYRLVLAARRYERLEKLAQEIQSEGGVALPIQTDLMHGDEIQRLVQRSLERFGQIDVLLNNAGMGRMNWLEDLEASRDIEDQMRINVFGVIYMTQAVLPNMIARRSGHIVNMASLAGLVGIPTYTAYCASKFAERGFSEALRREVGMWGIHVSVIYPGGVATEFSEHTGIKRRTGITTPAFLLLSDQDVAQAVLKVVRHPRRAVILPPVMNIAVWLNIALPGWLDWIIERRFVRPERQS
jgi:short-subunit dehydrogenase